MGGKLLLRFEDTDNSRNNLMYRDKILEISNIFNIKYQEITMQSHNMQEHVKIALELLKKNIAYYCSCEKWNQETCKCRSKNINKGVLRFHVKLPTVEFFDGIRGKIKVNNIEDFALLRSNGTPVYNLAVVVDDYMSKITHIMRGADHISNTGKQILIYEAMGWKLPNFYHFPLMLTPTGHKLSKRNNSLPCENLMKEFGILREALLSYLIRIGWSYGEKEYFTHEELSKIFHKGQFLKGQGKFDMDKLLSHNRYFLKQLSFRECYITYRKYFHGFNRKFMPLNEALFDILKHQFINIFQIIDSINIFHKKTPNYNTYYSPFYEKVREYAENNKNINTLDIKPIFGGNTRFMCEFFNTLLFPEIPMKNMIQIINLISGDILKEKLNYSLWDRIKILIKNRYFKGFYL